MKKRKEAKNKRLKAVIFDIGGVLALEKNNSSSKKNPGVHQRISKKLNLSLDTWFDSIDVAYSKSIQGQLTKKQFLRKVSVNLDISVRKLEKAIIDAHLENFKQNASLYEFAFNLKKQGYKIAILSDQWPLSKEAIVDKKLMKKFDSVVISCDVGMRKPNPDVYKLVLRKLKISPREAVFIDNREWNLKPAKKLGIKTILFKNNKQLFYDLKRIGIKAR